MIAKEKTARKITKKERKREKIAKENKFYVQEWGKRRDKSQT